MINKWLLLILMISVGISSAPRFTQAHDPSKPASVWLTQIVTPKDQLAQQGWSIAGSSFAQAGRELSSVREFSQAGRNLQQAAAQLRQASLLTLALGTDAGALSAALGTMALSMDAAGQTIATSQFDKTVYQLELLDQALKDFRFWFEKDDKLKAAFELAVANLEDAIGFMEGLVHEGEMLKVVNDMIETARRMSQEDVARQVEQILAITDPLIRHLMELDDPEVIEGLRMLCTAEASAWLTKVSPDPRAWLLGAMQEGFVLALARVGTQLNSAGTTLLFTPVLFLISFCCPDDCTLGSISNCRVSAVSVVLAGHTPGSEKTLQKVTPQQGKGIVQGWKAIWKNTQLVDIYVKCAWQKCENTGCFPCFWQTDTDWVDKESGWVRVINTGNLGPSWLPPSVWDQADKKNFQDLANATCTATCR